MNAGQSWGWEWKREKEFVGIEWENNLMIKGMVDGLKAI